VIGFYAQANYKNGFHCSVEVHVICTQQTIWYMTGIHQMLHCSGVSSVPYLKSCSGNTFEQTVTFSLGVALLKAVRIVTLIPT
jgi:hypothetical protein